MKNESDDPLQRYGQVHEVAAILDAILNFSKHSRVTKVHPAARRIMKLHPLGYPSKTIDKRNLIRYFQVQ